MTFIVGKVVSRRGWWVQEEYGVRRTWGPFWTQRGAICVANRLKRRADLPAVRV